MLSLCDDVELSVLAETGDLHIAECVGLALRTTWEMLAAVIGVNPDLLEVPSG